MEISNHSETIHQIMPWSHIHVLRPSSYCVLKMCRTWWKHRRFWLRSYWVPTWFSLGSYYVVHVYTRFLSTFSPRPSRSYCVIVSAYCILSTFVPFALRLILHSLNVLHKKYKIKHCALYMQCVTLLKHFPLLFCFFFRLKQGCLHVCYHVYVVLVEETLAETARILSYCSCDVSNFLCFYKY